MIVIAPSNVPRLQIRRGHGNLDGVCFTSRGTSIGRDGEPGLVRGDLVIQRFLRPSLRISRLCGGGSSPSDIVKREEGKPKMGTLAEITDSEKFTSAVNVPLARTPRRGHVDYDKVRPGFKRWA